MVRSKQSAADYVERRDQEMRIILAELIENASEVNRLWAMARMQAKGAPEHAFRQLIDAETRLDIAVRIERADSLRILRSAIKRLDRELPDDEDDDSTDLPTR
jgi:hypothetical protein